MTHGSPRRRLPRPAVVAAVLALAGPVLLTGCGQGENDSERLDPDFTASTSTTAALGPEAAAQKRAEELVYQYVSSRDTVRQDPGAYLSKEPLLTFVEASAFTELRGEVLDLSNKARRQVGTVELSKVTTRSVELRPERTGAGASNPVVEVDACLDDSGVEVIDARTGEAVGSRPRGPRTVRFGVVNRHWPSTTGWRVSWTKEQKSSC